MNIALPDTLRAYVAQRVIRKDQRDQRLQRLRTLVEDGLASEAGHA